MHKLVLLTGDQGFIGTNLRSVLEQNGFRVHGLDVRGADLNEIVSITKQKVKEFSYSAVFHVGANSNTLETNVQRIMLENVESTWVIASHTQKAGIPLIFSSSAACYGVDGEFPSNLYAWTKLIAERIVLSMGGVALRYFNVYGPGEASKRNMASFVHQAYELSLSGETPRLFPGNPMRDFIHVEDVCLANIVALENYDQVKGDFYDVGTGEAHTFEECLEIFDLSWEYSDQNDIPAGYQFFTQARKSKWLPIWKPKNFDVRMREYKAFMGKSF